MRTFTGKRKKTEPLFGRKEKEPGNLSQKKKLGGIRRGEKGGLPFFAERSREKDCLPTKQKAKRRGERLRSPPDEKSFFRSRRGAREGKKIKFFSRKEKETTSA